MAFPKQKDIEMPLLAAIAQLGGEARPRDIYPIVARSFPDLTAEELEERLENYPSTRKWTNLVQWVRQKLVDAGEIDGSTRGVWKITQAGRSRLGTQGPVVAEPNLRDLMNAHVGEVKARILTELKALSPAAFEHFCGEFLGHLGFLNVTVTRRTQDGGLDGYGDFRQGAISIKSAFQAKRWTDNAIGRPEIDKLRGAIQGEFDHGVFLTTSRFSRDAKSASYKKGAITVLLLDGPAIAEMLLERGLGVQRQPLYLYELDKDFFDIEEDE